MDNMLTLGIILSAKDAFSPAFSKMGDGFKTITKDMKSFGTAAAGIGTALKGVQLATQGGAETVIKSFVDLEEARTQLKNTLMKSDGTVSPFFKSISDEAVKLGNKLPGTTADFLQMASSMKALGVEEKSIVGGALKSAAYLGSVLKIPYEEAAEATAKFKQAMGIADSDLLPFIDDIQRMAHMGVKVGEMSFAFSKLGATMKGLGMSGLKASRDVEPLVGMLIKSGFSGETVGTNLGNIMKDAVSFKGNKQLDEMGIDLNFNDAAGNFKGTENMIKELEKLKAIKSDSARLGAVEAIFGKGEASTMANVLINEGSEGLKKFNHQMKIQADINARAAASGATLGAMWESMTGTFTNFLAVVGESFSGEMKGLTSFFSSTSEWLSEMAKEYPMFAKFVGFLAIGIPVITGVLGTLGVAVGAVTMAMGALGITTMLTFGTVMVVLAGIGIIAYAIIANWEEMSVFWGGLWNDVKSSASSAWDFLKTIFSWTPLAMVINNWTPIVGVFKSIIGMITKPFSDFFLWVESKFNTVSSGLNSIGSFFGISGPSPTPSRPKANPTVASARSAVATRSGGSNNTVAVTINNPNFTSKEHATQTQKQIDEQVRKAMQKQANDKKDRSYS